MRKLFLGTVLTVASGGVWADAPGGPGCGWGNMLFEGQRGLPSHLVASTTNASSGNKTFGMTSGTNGCRTNGRLGYSGKPMLLLGSIMDELSEDMAQGQGEALTTYAVSLGIQPEDRGYFAQLTHQHFGDIFTSAKVTAAEVLDATLDLMEQDERLSRYVQSA